MSAALDRLRATRRTLRVLVAARALLWGAAAGAIVAALRTLGAPNTAWWDALTVTATVGAAIAVLWRGAPRGVSMESAALWIEARVPSLRYALVTLANPAAVIPESAMPTLDGVVRSARWDDAIRHATWRALLPPAAVLATAIGLARIAPLRDAVRHAERAVGGGSATATVDRLARVRATITPPAYSGLPARRLDDPTSIDALVGSAIVLEGRGRPEGLVAETRGDSGAASAIRVASHDDGWRAVLAMPERAMALRLADGARTRLVVLAPRADLPPRVTLALPARDTVLRAPSGSIALGAAAEDDLGLASARFEYIVSSGEGESFTFKSGTVGATSLGGTRGAMRATLSIDALALKPGDLVHVRAVARDRNPSPAHGAGASETRTIRVARAGEYDSVAVDAAPPIMGDTSALSQRMLLMLTEALAKRQRAIVRPMLVSESQKIAQDQARLRKRVGDLVFQRIGEGEGEESQGESEKRANMSPEELLAAASAATGTDLSKPLEGNEEETPVVAINKPLLEAYNHMWDAGRALEVAEPAKAIPPMRLAILALEKARAAERIYLRGKPPAAVVDLAKVRLAAKLGADTMKLADRAPRAPLDAKTRTRLESLGRAIGLLTTNASAAADTLALLRVDALGDAPALAAALGDAADDLRNRRDATAALVRARRLAAGAPARADSLGGWAW